MTSKEQNSVVGTSRGKPITDADIERLAAEAEAGYDITTLRPRGGRPPMGSGPAEVVPVLLDPELRAAVEARATADHTTTSEIIREALATPELRDRVGPPQSFFPRPSHGRPGAMRSR